MAFAPARRSASRSRKVRRVCCSATSATSRSGPAAPCGPIQAPATSSATTRRCASGSGSTRRAGRLLSKGRGTGDGGSVILNPDRYFDPDPAVRRGARALYEETRDLPIISPHGHVDPRILAEDTPFPEPASLIVQPDHYVLRLLYAHGVALEDLGVRSRDAGPFEADPCKVWQRFADHYYLFDATPTGAWLNYELHEVFGITEPLWGDTAPRIYDEMREKLASPEFRPRALFERFNIEVLATTDAATDSLEHHQKIRASGWGGRVVPTFRPDALFRIALPTWADAVAALGKASGRAVDSQEAFVAA